jgi:ABC-2 family transporter protein
VILEVSSSSPIAVAFALVVANHGISQLHAHSYKITSEMLALLVVLGLLYPVAAMISYITREKEQGQKELMKMMSAAESDIGWSWFVSFLSFNIVTATIVSAVSMALFVKSEGLLLWMFWIFFFLALTVFCMFLATLTSKTTRAVVIGLLM